MHARAHVSRTPNAYQLPCRELRLAAVLELQQVFDQGLYSTANKKLQQAIFDDLLVAAQQRDR